MITRTIPDPDSHLSGFCYQHGQLKSVHLGLCGIYSNEIMYNNVATSQKASDQGIVQLCDAHMCGAIISVFIYVIISSQEHCQRLFSKGFGTWQSLHD